MADEQEAEYQRALDALSGLISGRQRKDGAQWAHAFEMMQCYLEASGGEGCLRSGPRWWSSAVPPAPSTH